MAVMGIERMAVELSAFGRSPSSINFIAGERTFCILSIFSFDGGTENRKKHKPRACI
jgi:hypothetical protein